MSFKCRSASLQIIHLIWKYIIPAFGGQSPCFCFSPRSDYHPEYPYDNKNDREAQALFRFISICGKLRDNWTKLIIIFFLRNRLLLFLIIQWRGTNGQGLGSRKRIYVIYVLYTCSSWAHADCTSVCLCNCAHSADSMAPPHIPWILHIFSYTCIFICPSTNAHTCEYIRMSIYLYTFSHA